MTAEALQRSDYERRNPLETNSRVAPSPEIGPALSESICALCTARRYYRRVRHLPPMISGPVSLLPYSDRMDVIYTMEGAKEISTIRSNNAAYTYLAIRLHTAVLTNDGSAMRALHQARLSFGMVACLHLLHLYLGDRRITSALQCRARFQGALDHRAWSRIPTYKDGQCQAPQDHEVHMSSTPEVGSLHHPYPPIADASLTSGLEDAAKMCWRNLPRRFRI